MQAYLDLLQTIIAKGTPREDRTGTGTLGIFGYSMRFPLDKNFPLLTTKKVHFKSVVHELLWFLSGRTNIAYLKENGVSIWDEWADNQGELGPIYGKQWRAWGAEGIDQIKALVEGIKKNPQSRRHIVSAWNPTDLPRMQLPPCHILFQCYVAEGRLSLCLYQRSADVFLGVPFNIACYSLLTCMLAQVCGLAPGEFVHCLGDAHLYLDHIGHAKLQLSRVPRSLPELILRPQNSLFAYRYEDIGLTDYTPYPGIKAKVSV